jgi:hypothetical protein
MYVSGPGVARGYRNLPELTRERFLPDPFAGDGERMYRSGDLARLLDNGELEVLGRVDDQVKVRGFRVEPGEIAQTLDAHPAVSDVLVVPREEGPGDVRLVAYAVARDVPQDDADARERTAAELIGLARSGLPEYMVPSAVVLLDALPLTPNGKVDKRALPAPGTSRTAATGEYVAPRDELEKQIAGVWSELLGVEQVGAYDDFFDLGGHSLLATRVTGRLKAALHKDVRVRTLFEQPVLAAFAKELSQTAPNGSAGPAPAPITARPRRKAGAGTRNSKES